MQPGGVRVKFQSCTARAERSKQQDSPPLWKWLCMKDCPWGWHCSQEGPTAPPGLIFLFTNEVPWQEVKVQPSIKGQSLPALTAARLSLTCCPGTDSLLTPFGVVAPKQSVSWLFSNVPRVQPLPVEETLPSLAVFTQIRSPAVSRGTDTGSPQTLTPLSSSLPTAQPSSPALLPGTHRYTFETLLAACSRSSVRLWGCYRTAPAAPTATLTQWSSGSSSRAAPALSSPAAGRRSLGEKEQRT